MFTYQWKKVGSDSLPNTASGENSTQLTITLVTPSDSGLYYCIVMNQWGNVEESDNATVNVLCELYCGYTRQHVLATWATKLIVCTNMAIMHCSYT